MQGTATLREQTNSEAWEDWATVDPLWSILTEPSLSETGWDVDRFFETGEQAVGSLFTRAAELGLPRRRRRALDFGCGVGRLTRALAARVPDTLGLDIAPTMIAKARELNAGVSTARFEVYAGEDLGEYADATFDVVVSLFVLQHVPELGAIERYVTELVRVLAEGGLAIVQLPYAKPQAASPTTWRARLALRRRIALVLRRSGVSPRFLYRQLGWRPDMPMVAVPQDRVRDLVTTSGGTVVRTMTDTDFGGVSNAYYYISRTT
jgi:SAM-dependent methyltransferase